MARRRNTDGSWREIWRQAGNGDLLAARRLVKALERANYTVRTEPLSLEEIEEQFSADGVVRGIVRVEFDEVVQRNHEGFLDLLSAALTNSEMLYDTQYRVVDVDGNALFIEVSGDPTGILEREPDGGSAEPRCLVRFQPQQWINDYAVDSAPAFMIDVTERVDQMGEEAAREIRDSSYESDDLVADLHDHDGPFYVSCEEAIREYFDALSPPNDPS